MTQLLSVPLKEQAYIARQQLEQKAPPYDDVQISTTSFQTSVTVIPPDFTTSKVMELVYQ